MNIHHLELFYYVARHGGISNAVRHMPYGIQQPAMSSQILLLEQELGAKLFERRPFQLTTTGEELYAFIRPFFENLDTVKARLRKQTAPLLRIGASEIALRDHLPAVIEQVRRVHPELRWVLRSGYQQQMETWLQEGQIDLAVTPLENRPPASLQCQRLVKLPLVLLVPQGGEIRSASELWERDAIEMPLICLSATESISRRFQQGLKKLEVDWPTAIEASSLELVTRYVANGYGLGVNLKMPEIIKHPRVKVLPLEGFDPVEVAVFWRGKVTPVMQTVLEEAERHVRRVWPEG